jgi:hypothetical protein
VGKGDGRGPEDDSVRDARLIAPEEALLVGVTEDRPGVQDSPRNPFEGQVVLLEGQVARGGTEDGRFGGRHREAAVTVRPEGDAREPSFVTRGRTDDFLPR